MGKHRKPFREQPIQAFMAPPPVAAYPPVPYAPKASVNVEVLGAKNATVAKVTLSRHADWTAGSEVYRFEAAEASKREQGDVSDAEIGELLALGRAFQRLSRDLFREGHKRVRKASEARAAAEEAAEAKARHLPVEVHRRTREEWEAIQQQRYEQQGGKFDYKILQRSLGLASERTTPVQPIPRAPEQTVKYNVNEADILNRWIKNEAHDIESLKAEKKKIEETLRLLGETE